MEPMTIIVIGAGVLVVGCGAKAIIDYSRNSDYTKQVETNKKAINSGFESYVKKEKETVSPSVQKASDRKKRAQQRRNQRQDNTAEVTNQAAILDTFDDYSDPSISTSSSSSGYDSGSCISSSSSSSSSSSYSSSSYDSSSSNCGGSDSGGF